MMTVTQGEGVRAAGRPPTELLRAVPPGERGEARRDGLDEAPFDVSALPVLDTAQLGHLRHIQNLAFRPPGDWTHLGSGDPLQGGFTSYRYQIAHMAYALAAAHFHRLPAAPAVIRPAYDRLFQKMLRLDVWHYWKDTSQAGSVFDPDRTSLRDGWIDPVAKENIMYSGHVYAMAGMYGMLFDDDRFDEPGSISFVYDPKFYGMGKQRFEYNLPKLTEVIYWQMVESGWLGVPCEPNMIFLICNQFPMLGFRFYDLRHGTGLAEEATRSYRNAWRRKGWLDDNNQFVTAWQIKQDRVLGESSMTPWGHTFMNAWNSEMMHRLFPEQSFGVLREKSDGTAYAWPFEVLDEVRGTLRAGGSTELLDDSGAGGDSRFGFVALWLSEMGDSRVRKMFDYADRYFSPTWENGGLFYPRNDVVFDDRKNFVYVDPFVGNALIAHARLNVPDGHAEMYEHPWGPAQFTSPSLTELSGEVDVIRAVFVPEREALVLTLRNRTADKVEDARLTVSRARRGQCWRIFRGRLPVAQGVVGVPIHTHWGRVDWDDDQMLLALRVRSTENLVIEWKR